jgi:hypothetical protein
MRYLPAPLLPSHRTARTTLGGVSAATAAAAFGVSSVSGPTTTPLAPPTCVGLVGCAGVTVDQLHVAGPHSVEERMLAAYIEQQPLFAAIAGAADRAAAARFHSVTSAVGRR